MYLFINEHKSKLVYKLYYNDNNGSIPYTINKYLIRI